MNRLPPELSSQVRISRALGFGFVFTLVSLGGLGSMIAFVVGLRALRIISRSREALVGRRLALWCIAVGAIEMLYYIFHWYRFAGSATLR